MVLAQAMKQYAFNFLIGLDQFVNVITGGDPDETVSSRLGRIKTTNNGAIPWHRPLAKLTDYLLDKIQPGHSINAIEPDRGGQGVIDIPIKHTGKKWINNIEAADSQDDAHPITIHGAHDQPHAQGASWMKRIRNRNFRTR